MLISWPFFFIQQHEINKKKKLASSENGGSEGKLFKFPFGKAHLLLKAARLRYAEVEVWHPNRQ